MHESKSGECQLLKSSNCSHHPSDIICEGLHWTSFSPCTLSLKETPRLPPSSPTPWRTHGPDRPAMSTGTNPHHRWALWDLHPHRLAQNVTARSRGQRGQEAPSCLCQQVAPALGHQRRCNWWPTSQVSKCLTKPLPDVLHQKNYVFEHSHQDWDCQGSRLRVVGMTFREDKKKPSNPSPDELFYKMVVVGYSVGFWFSKTLMRWKGNQTTSSVKSWR